MYKVYSLNFDFCSHPCGWMKIPKFTNSEKETKKRKKNKKWENKKQREKVKQAILYIKWADRKMKKRKKKQSKILICNFPRFRLFLHWLCSIWVLTQVCFVFYLFLVAKQNSENSAFFSFFLILREQFNPFLWTMLRENFFIIPEKENSFNLDIHPFFFNLKIPSSPFAREI